MSGSKSPSPDFLDLWKRSEVPNKTDEQVAINRTSLSERFSGSRSSLWTNLSHMSPADQAVMMSKLTSQWPYDMERRAISWPMQTGILANCFTSGLIATRINADMVLMNPKMSFLEAVQKCPKSPFVFGVYSAGVTYYVLQVTTIMPSLYSEVHPCTSCILSKSVMISLFTGIMMPLIATPYLCYYVLLQRKNEKFPPVKNLLDMLMLSIGGGKSARSLLVRLVPLQVIVTAISTYTWLWGRERVFNTMDADPELTKELMLKIQSKASIKERIVTYLRKLPIVSDVIGGTEPENEKL